MMRQAPEFNRGAGMFLGVDAFVEANGRVQPALQFDVAEDIVPAERLLDHHQVVGFQAFQVRPVFQAIGGVGVDHQANSRETADAGVRPVSMSFPGLILILMRWYPAANSRSTVAISSSTVSLIPMETPQEISWCTPPSSFQRGIFFCLASASHTADFDRALGHVVPANRFQNVPDIRGGSEFPIL